MPQVNSSHNQSVSETLECVSCGNIFSGNFCNQCGEKLLIQDEKTFKYFLRKTWRDVTLIDNKLFRTLKMILIRPGHLSSEIAKGKRVNYLSPVSLFFLGNLIYFLFPLFSTFNTQLSTQMSGLVYSEWFNIEERVQKKLASKEIKFEAFEKSFNESSYTNSKLMLVIIVPMFSVFLALFNYGRKEFYLEHLTYSYEFISVMLFSTVIGFGIFVSVFHWISFDILGIGLHISEFWVSWAVIGIAVVFIVSGVRRYYELGILRSLLVGTGLTVSYIFIVFLYRLILFEVTFFFN